jgi:DNA helicase II / ATP-dependent DNA helicase PcrA
LVEAPVWGASASPRICARDGWPMESRRLVTAADDIGQVSFVVETVLRNREGGIALKEQAVLFRTSHHSAMLEIELARRNIPFVKFGGLKFVEAAHVKDVLAVLRWAENPTDRVTGFRVVQMLDGIGPTTAGRILDRMAGRSASDALGTFSPPAKAASAWRDLVALMARLRDDNAEWPAQFDFVRHWFQPHLEQRYPDAVVRAGDLDQLQRIAAGYPSRTRFLTDLTLDPPSATSDEAGPPLLDEDYLILSTIHSAKGQEWRAVFVLNIVDGCILSDMATGNADDIEEERRLLYVAMTRAKDHLALIVPHRFYVAGQARGGDKHLYASRTRFIPAGILSDFDVCTWPLAAPAAAAAGNSGVKIDLAARMHACGAAAGS